MPPSYKSFLNKHGGKDPVILQGVKEIASGIPFTNLKAIENVYKASGVNIKLDPAMKVPCSVWILLNLKLYFVYLLLQFKLPNKYHGVMSFVYSLLFDMLSIFLLFLFFYN